MKMSRNLTKIHVKATTVNMKTGKAASRIYIVQTNGFMYVRESLKTQIGKNERIEHVEVL